MNSRIIFSVLIAFGITILAFYLLYNFFPDPTITRNNHEFYLQELNPEERKIFLVGSSHMGQLNTTHIIENVSQKFPNKTVYNLSFNRDKPEERIEDIDHIISHKPELVVYGISYRDFHYPKNPNESNLGEIFSLLLSDKNNELDEINPQFITIKSIKKILNQFGIMKESTFELKNTPFHQIGYKQTKIANDNELEKMILKSGASELFIRDYSENQQVIYLEKIIEKLQNHEIDIILITTPTHKMYRESISEESRKHFNPILEKISSNLGIKIVNYNEKYSDMNIWRDLSHIAYNQNAIIFSEDISKMIIKEIEK